MRRSIPLALSALSLASTVFVVPAEAIAAASHTATYKGATYVAGNGRPWGDISVTIQVKGKKITSITASLTNDNFEHSVQLDSYAFPLLKKEALKSNSYKINAISGATQSSEAYIASLKSALNKAHI